MMPRSNISRRFDKTVTNDHTILDDLDIHFQPIVDLEKGSEIQGFEALGRKMHVGGVTSIGPYIDEIYASGLRPEMELRTLESAIGFIRLCDQNLDPQRAARLYVTVNLHHQTLSQPKLLKDVDDQLQIYPAAKDRVRFEILEHPFPRRTQAKIMTNIHALHGEGFQLYLDDFGDHPGIDENRLEDTKGIIYGIKLSGSLWERDEESRHRFLDYLASPDLAGKVIVLEGVETDDQITAVMQLGDKYGFSTVFAQGWHPLLGASMTPQSAVELMSQWQQNPQASVLEK